MEDMMQEHEFRHGVALADVTSKPRDMMMLAQAHQPDMSHLTQYAPAGDRPLDLSRFQKHDEPQRLPCRGLRRVIEGAMDRGDQFAAQALAELSSMTGESLEFYRESTFMGGVKNKIRSVK
jgi:hypothetical protein